MCQVIRGGGGGGGGRFDNTSCLRIEAKVLGNICCIVSFMVDC